MGISSQPRPSNLFFSIGPRDISRVFKVGDAMPARFEKNFTRNGGRPGLAKEVVRGGRDFKQNFSLSWR
jgi:hypothetical protein